MLRPVLVTPPALKPVTLAQAKAQCRVDGDDEDELIEDLIDAAVSHLDGWSGILGRCLVTQTWRVDYGGWGGVLALPFPDVASASVAYRDTAGAPQVVASGDVLLEADALGSAVRFVSGWSEPALLSGGLAPVSVTFVAGYGAPAAVPAALRRAILLLIGHWYANREAVVTGTIASDLPLAVAALVGPHRVVRL